MENNDLKMEALVIRLNGSTAAELKRALQLGHFNDWRRPYVESWMKKLEEDEKNAPIVLFHRRKAPTGKTFKAYETPDLEKNGWVDSPEKFRKTLWQRLREMPNPATTPTADKKPNSIETKEWYQRPIGIVGLTIFAGVVIALAIYLIKKHLGIPL